MNKKILLKELLKEILEEILIQVTIGGSLAFISMIGCLLSGIFSQKGIPEAIITGVEEFFYEIKMELKSRD